MNNDRIEKNQLKEISRQRDISFSNVLATYIAEKIIISVSNSAYQKELWLKDEDNWNFTEKELMSYYRLQYCYVPPVEKGRKSIFETENGVNDMLQQIFVKENYRGIRFKYKYEEREKSIVVDAVFEYEEMSIPLQIEVKAASKRSFEAEMVEKEAVVHAGRQLQYLCYPTESILSEQLLHLIKYMELIPTMEAYETVYHIISEDILQGSHICRRLEELCERENLVCHEKKGEMLADYISYVYMQKKWDKYRKSLKNKELPKWEDVMSKIVTFVSPIWNAICKKERFIGTWIPELERFLD